MTENTGPKGVISDARVAAAQASNDRLRARRERTAQAVAHAPTTTTVLDDVAEKKTSLKLVEAGFKAVPSQETLEEYTRTMNVVRNERHEAEVGEEDSDLDSELDELIDLDMNGERKREDMSVLLKWREDRLRELKANATVPSSHAQSHSFGKLIDADSDGYLEALESGDRNQVVIVLLYDESQESKMISALLSQIAQQYITISFVQMHYSETEMDKVGIPAILAYTDHGDRIVANIARVVDELPPTSRLEVANLESVLKR
ncbi:hypothetical protein POJ06DRAFT_250728 [Lipomyces tetrasporus]|uniref:Thioredoxin-like protein n=1 Tax=Lipomyces tetrasporus TaxID=54092 RepID=A0AAD7VSM3_9ASCO|nr:uncharacterized protein POJ06DRAFT_250728 [Lipomyces tetrasporus]KAJ8101197.1 hypothetical protein POJ06DRAFT_250728 [Lipomyces tetrasporus]